MAKKKKPPGGKKSVRRTKPAKRRPRSSPRRSNGPRGLAAANRAEEVTSVNEDLQSLNEEMQTVNHQLAQKVAELESTNSDLDNLLSITEVATILLDPDLRIKRFTDATAKHFRVIQSDIGRPLGDLARNFTDDDLLPDAQRVLRDLTPRAKEIQDTAGRSYLQRIVPYRTDDSHIGGVVIIITDVTDRREREQALTDYGVQLEKDVAQRTTQLEQLAYEMADLTEQERQRLGRALHDTLGQQLTAIGVLAATLKDHQENERTSAEVSEKLETSIEEAKRQIRALSKGLFPVDVDSQGLRIALEELAKETSSIYRISCRCECESAPPIESNFTATQLFLIAREATINAARHANATQLLIKLEETNGLRLTVEDNGRGLPKDPAGNSGMGLRIMRHRAELMGGTLQFDSIAGRGTRLILKLKSAK
jgi:two-component system CheB/CheR fusion protein